jgi:hypothetical protein
MCAFAFKPYAHVCQNYIFFITQKKFTFDSMETVGILNTENISSYSRV